MRQRSNWGGEARITLRIGNNSRGEEREKGGDAFSNRKEKEGISPFQEGTVGPPKR